MARYGVGRLRDIDCARRIAGRANIAVLAPMNCLRVNPLSGGTLPPSNLRGRAGAKYRKSGKLHGQILRTAPADLKTCALVILLVDSATGRDYRAITCRL